MFHIFNYLPRMILLVLFACLTLSCTGTSNKENPERTRISLSVGSTQFQVELASTPEERQMGLMFRTEMTDKQGMLFIFDRDQQLNFWMKNTHLPLSIAYISSDGIIKEIHDMKPFSLDTVESSRSVRYALEVNQGAFARAGVKVGDQVIIP